MSIVKINVRQVIIYSEAIENWSPKGKENEGEKRRWYDVDEEEDDWAICDCNQTTESAATAADQ